MVEKARRLAAYLLEADEADLEPPADDRFAVRGAPDRSITWAELAAAAADPARLPGDLEPGLVSAGRFRQSSSSFPFGAHVAVVEIDIETGAVRLLRHVAVDDCGRILNPMLVDGQVHGGLAQGIAQALFEEVVFDELGNPLSTTLTTYAMPSAAFCTAVDGLRHLGVRHLDLPLSPERVLGAIARAGA